MMLIKQKWNDPTFGARKASMRRAKEAAMRHCRLEREKRSARGSNAKFRKGDSVHFDALAEAVRSEGPEVLSAAAKGYWDDMKRANPWMCIDGEVPDGNSANGHRGRHGVVKERYVAGIGWMHWENGEWQPGEATGRKGI